MVEQLSNKNSSDNCPPSDLTEQEKQEDLLLREQFVKYRETHPGSQSDMAFEHWKKNGVKDKEGYSEKFLARKKRREDKRREKRKKKKEAAKNKILLQETNVDPSDTPPTLTEKRKEKRKKAAKNKILLQETNDAPSDTPPKLTEKRKEKRKKASKNKTLLQEQNVDPSDTSP